MIPHVKIIVYLVVELPKDLAQLKMSLYEPGISKTSSEYVTYRKAKIIGKD